MWVRTVVLAACLPVLFFLPAVAQAESGKRPAAGAAVPGRYIVVLKGAVEHPQAVAEAQVQQHRADLGGVYRYALEGYLATGLSRADAEALRRNPKVASVRMDHRIGIDLEAEAAEEEEGEEVEVPNQIIPTGVSRVFAPSNPAADIDGIDDVRVNADVAVIDTGVDYEHPDLNVVGTVNCLSSCDEKSPITVGDHGTHVAGTIGALDNEIGVVGVAPGARLWSVEVLTPTTAGWESAVIAGVDWVTAHASKIDVANMSLRFFNQGETLPVDEAVTASIKAGVTYVVGAGNEHGDAKYVSPADVPAAITVSGLYDTDGKPGYLGGFYDDIRAGFSNYGAGVDIAAPGVIILSTVSEGGYSTNTGTSMATPHVTGAAAILESEGYGSPSSIREQLVKQSRYAEEVGLSAWTDDSGDGIKEPLLYAGGLIPPTGETKPASVVGSYAATLNGVVNPHAQPETTYQFEYGTGSGKYTQVLPASPVAIGTGIADLNVSQRLTGLEPNKTYYYRLVATNGNGVSLKGGEQSFTTPVAIATYSSSFGSYGTGNGQFKEPRGITVDPSGNVWVSDINLNRIQKFNSKGEYVCQVGTSGSGNGQFKKPRGLAADASGNVWVADEGNNRLQKISSACGYLSQLGSAGSGNGQMYQPYGVAIDPSGNILVADSGNARIGEFNSKGEFVAKCGTEGTGNGQFEEGPVSIAADADGNVWAGDGNPRVEQFNTKCEYLAKFDKTSSGAPYFTQPAGIAIDSTGNLWIPNSLTAYGYQAFYPEGEYVGQFGEVGTGSGQFSVPRQIAIAPDGSLWAIDSFNTTARVQKWLPGTPSPVETGRAAQVKATEATLTGKVNPGGIATSYQFEWGTTTSLGSFVPASPKSIGSGSSPVAVSQVLGGLKSGQTYYYRLVASSEKGTTYGKMRHFTGGKPENTVAPTISPATPYQNVAETASNGTWLGGAASFSYQWQRCNAEGKECVNISGATAQTYTPVEADVGKTLVVKVTNTAPNGAATTVASSPSGKVVAAGQLTEYALPAGSGPQGVAAGPDGNVWFANWGTKKIGKITTGGTKTEYSLSAGVGPMDITAGPDGNLWFTAETEAETGAGKIGKITTAGTKTEYALPTGFYPSGIVAGPDGNLWFTSWSTNKIGKITTSGTKTEYTLPAGAGSYDIVAGPDGNLWFTDAGLSKIGKITTAGTVTEYALPCCGGTPYGIAAGPDGNLWFARAGDKVGKITTGGTITEYSVPIGSEPTYITSGPDKALWFLERKSKKVARITTSGTVSEYALPAGSETSRAIAAGSDNRIWLALGGTNKIAAVVP
jgi:streptogramin lyase/subtilisin family serine protease